MNTKFYDNMVEQKIATAIARVEAADTAVRVARDNVQYAKAVLREAAAIKEIVTARAENAEKMSRDAWQAWRLATAARGKLPRV